MDVPSFPLPWAAGKKAAEVLRVEQHLKRT